MYARGEMPWVVWENQRDRLDKQPRAQIDKTNGERIVLDRSHLVAHSHRIESNGK